MLKTKGGTPLILLSDMLTDANIGRVMAIDKEWKLIAWNKTSENISGLKREEVVGKLLIEVFPQLKDDEAIISAIEKAMDGKTCFLPAESGSFNKNFYESHFIPLKDKDENVLGVISIMHEVSHRMKDGHELERLGKALHEK